MRVHATDARESLDKAVLFLAFVVGAGGTIGLKLYEAPVLVIALFPVAVLLAYVAACLSLRNIGTEPETIGDNSYYLGFLFTLASLAVTLYRIKDVGSADVDLIPLVISGFGVALSSTIAGVFLRVFLLQLRPDIVARDREARRDLANGARELREAMTAASRQLKTIAVETQQHVAERNSKMSEVLEIQVLKTSELLERQARSYDDVIKEFGRKLTEEFSKQMRKQTSAASEEINKAAKEFAENLAALTRSRVDVEAGLTTSMTTFRAVVDDIRTATVKRDEADEAVRKYLAAHSKKISQYMTEASETTQAAVKMSRLALEESQRAIGGARNNLQKDEDEFRRHTESVTRSLLDLEKAVSERVIAITRLPPSVEPAPAPVAPSAAAPVVPSSVATNSFAGVPIATAAIAGAPIATAEPSVASIPPASVPATPAGPDLAPAPPTISLTANWDDMVADAAPKGDNSSGEAKAASPKIWPWGSP